MMSLVTWVRVSAMNGTLCHPWLLLCKITALDYRLQLTYMFYMCGEVFGEGC